jgi:hypothetical protein
MPEDILAQLERTLELHYWTPMRAELEAAVKEIRRLREEQAKDREAMREVVRNLEARTIPTEALIDTAVRVLRSRLEGKE